MSVTDTSALHPKISLVHSGHDRPIRHHDQPRPAPPQGERYDASPSPAEAHAAGDHITPRQRWAHLLVLDIINANLPLARLADHLKIPFDTLIDYIKTPEVQAEIDAYEELNALRARLLGEAARPISLRKLLDVLESPAPSSRAATPTPINAYCTATPSSSAAPRPPSPASRVPSRRSPRLLPSRGQSRECQRADLFFRFRTRRCSRNTHRSTPAKGSPERELGVFFLLFTRARHDIRASQTESGNRRRTRADHCSQSHTRTPGGMPGRRPGMRR
ncbi:MAG: hypothetical protein KF705_11305 [Phycisphaeraceae bacterium]|nr:hypothetical protein [Phycisphaeraceae bacterium]